MLSWRSLPQNPSNTIQTKANLPLVSVIIPAYNAEQFIAKTLASVLNQTYRHLEVIIVDDGSQDKTIERVQSFLDQDTRVILLRQENSGVSAARNLAIQMARGELIAPIDADDIWYPKNLEKQVQCLLNADSAVGVVYSWSIDIDECDRITSGFHAARIRGRVYKTLLAHNFLGNASSTLIRKQCLEQVGGYSSEFRANQVQGCEDWELYLRLAERYEFEVVPEFLVGYRKLNNSMSDDFQVMAKSHLVMLHTARTRQPNTANCLYQLSRSSFYLYFAHQSLKRYHYHQTLFWLKQALAIDLTPLIRFGFYILLIQVGLQKLLRSHQLEWVIRGMNLCVAATPIHTNSYLNSATPLLQQQDRRIKSLIVQRSSHPFPLKVFFKILISHFLHCWANWLQAEHSLLF